jgi:uncharacterized membrane protein
MIKEILFVAIAGFLPVSELRGAIPLGILVYGMNPFFVFFLSLAVNALVIPVCWFFLKYLSDYLMRNIYFFNRFLNWVFSRTREKHTQTFERWGKWGLMIFIAIPLPMTGAWSGVIAAFLFGFDFKDALKYGLLGVLIAGLVVFGVTLAVPGFFEAARL